MQNVSSVKALPVSNITSKLFLLPNHPSFIVRFGTDKSANRLSAHNGKRLERDERERERGERERERERVGERERERERENSNSKTLFSKDCSLSSF